MIGYVFITENTANNKKYIGKYFSVRFDRKYLGDNYKLLDDVKKYGADKFTVKMLRASETVQECEMAYSAFIEDADALNNPMYYNCEIKKADEPIVEDASKKRTRKKRSEE